MKTQGGHIQLMAIGVRIFRSLQASRQSCWSEAEGTEPRSGERKVRWPECSTIKPETETEMWRQNH